MLEEINTLFRKRYNLKKESNLDIITLYFAKQQKRSQIIRRVFVSRIRKYTDFPKQTQKISCGKARPACKTDNLTAIYELTV
jgi:hypothetical protein